jgi:addiction module HigA family antidote
MMSRKNRTHPGEIVKHDCLEPLGLSITDAAKVLGVTRPTLSKLVNGRASISPEMAIRLAKAFGSTPEFWLRLQLNYDLAQIQARSDEIKVERYRPNDLDSEDGARRNGNAEYMDGMTAEGDVASPLYTN